MSSVYDASQIAADAFVSTIDMKNTEIRNSMIAFIVEGLGSIQWRRVLSENAIGRLYDIIKDKDDANSQDASHVEWIAAPLLAFYSRLEKAPGVLAAEVGNIVALSNTLSLTDDAKALDADVGEMVQVLTDHPVALFCFLLYHSGYCYSL